MHLKIHGLVQGVCFRAYTKETAKKLNLTGWVKNCYDNSVEILAQGEKNDLEKLLAWCHHGPELAKVEKVEINWEEIEKKFTNFYIAD